MSKFAVGSIAGLLGGNPLLLLLGHILQPGTDWKAVLREEGAEVAKKQVQTAWHKKVTPADLAGIAAKMEGEGWSWEAAGNPAFLAEQKVEISESDRTLYGDAVNGFIISRDAVFSILRETGVPGGGIRDGWRDYVDNKTWEGIAARVTPTTPLPEIVTATFEELVRVVL